MSKRMMRIVAIVLLMNYSFQEVVAAGEAVFQKRTTEELDTILGPIALYPDVLIAQILPASTFPEQIPSAYVYASANKEPAEIDSQPWDDSVKALAHYPDVLKMMTQNIDWTTELGDVFMHQQKDVMDSIQQLRVKAKAAGALADTEQQKVVTEKEVIYIEPASPEVVYVPQYDPQTVYVESSGYSGGEMAAVGLLSFGTGMALGAWMNMGCNYHSGFVACGGYYGHGNYGAVWGPNGGVARGPNGGAAWSRSGAYRATPYNTSYRQNGNVNINKNNNFNRNNINSGNRGNINSGNRTGDRSNIGSGNRVNGGNNSISGSRERPANRSAQNSAANSYDRGSQTRQASNRGAQSTNTARTPQQRPSQSSSRNYSGGSQRSSGQSFGGYNGSSRSSSSRGQSSRGGGGRGGGGRGGGRR